MAMTNARSQQECCVKLEDSDDTNTCTCTTTVASTVNGPTSTVAAAAPTVATNNNIEGKATAKTCRSSESDDSNGNGKFINGPPTKKLKMNNIKKEDDIDDDDSDNSKEYKGNNSNDMTVGSIKQEITSVNRNHCHHKIDNNIEPVDIMIKEEETKTEKVNSIREINGNNNYDDDDYKSWTKGSWCWLLPASSRGSGGGGGVDFLKQHTVQHNDCDNYRPLLNDDRGKEQYSYDSENDDDIDDNEKFMKNEIEYKAKNDNSKNNDSNQDEDEDAAVGEDGYKNEDDNDNDNDNDDDDDDDYDCDETEGDTEYKTNNTNNKYNDENEITVEDNAGDEDDDAGYDSWTEGSWCWLLPNSTLVTTKNKIIHPSDPLMYVSKPAPTIRVCHLTQKTQTPQHIIYTHSQNEKWNTMFRQLVAYHKQHQTTNVPNRWKDDPQLGAQLGYWVACQREYFKNGTISSKRAKLLNSLSFVWRLRDQNPWMEMYQRLVVHKNQHQTTNIPQKYKADPKLGKWVHHQRVFYKNKELSMERTNYLDSIGFVWKVFDRVPWADMFERLVAYKQHNQSTQVPTRYTTDPPLGRWVGRQREEYNKDKLSARRVGLLNSINFVWCAK